VWRCIYDEDVSVEVPSGRHRIRLENAHPGGSWIRVSSYTLSNYSPPAIRALGLSGRSLSILWVQNKESTWWNEKLGRHPKPIGGAKVDIALAEDGQYDVEWWDTYKGILLLSKRLKSNRKILTISVPALERDCAYKIRWAGGR
jgi:hypothetical protein